MEINQTAWTRLANVYVGIVRNALTDNANGFASDVDEKELLRSAAVLGLCTAVASEEQRFLLKEAIDAISPAAPRVHRASRPRVKVNSLE
jgi:hypothetical protein